MRQRGWKTNREKAEHRAVRIGSRHQEELDDFFSAASRGSMSLGWDGMRLSMKGMTRDWSREEENPESAS